MNKVGYKLDRAIVTIMTEITEESMVALVDEIERLASDYFYKTIELRISSPGGNALALDYYLGAIGRFREQGIEIHTRALTQATSAAAAILSLGDGPRRAASSSVLVYHFHRTSAQELTAQKARALMRLLGETDRRMTLRIAERAFLGYGPHRSGEACVRRNPDVFSDNDWRIMLRLTVNRFEEDHQEDGGALEHCLAAMRQRVAEECERSADASGFFRLYDELFEINAPISAALACELRLIDALVDDEASCPLPEPFDARTNAVQIPQWNSLFSPHGHIERAALCRHVIAFGETGSGKTQSAILPVLKAILRQADRDYEGDSPVSCALVIDPKKELLPILQNGAPRSVAVRVLKTNNNGEDGLRLNLMDGAWSIDEELANDDMLGAAQKIFRRCASFAPQNPAFETVLGRGGGHNGYWKEQGMRLAQTILALLLILLKYRTVIYDPENLNALAPYVKDKLRTFGVAAGIVGPQAERAGQAYKQLSRLLMDRAEDRAPDSRPGWRPPRYSSPAYKARDAKKPVFSVEERRELRKAWRAFTDGLCGGPRKNPALRRQLSDRRKAFAELLKSKRSEGELEVVDRLGAVAESCWDLACPVLPHESIAPTRNLMVLAALFQRLFFISGSGIGSNEKARRSIAYQVARDEGSRLKAHRTHLFLAHRWVEESLRHLIGGGREINDVFEDVDFFHDLSLMRNNSQLYMGLYAFAKPSFSDFSESGPANALFFGCEPFLCVTSRDPGDEDPANLFKGAINANGGGTIFVYQPSLGHGQDTLIARVLKAQYFETVLSDPQRQKSGSKMPLVAYVADEFHRFITSDVVHGEQSFFDTCRSFGAFCVVASQSMSSLHHALAGSHFTNKDEKAVEILLNNTGTKLFFRTTDSALHETIARLCPLTPDRPKATQVRPPSTLRPGECYAVLTDGRFLRCRIDLNAKCTNESKLERMEA